MTLINVDIDPDRIFDRGLTEFERKQLPFATMTAINQTAFETRDRFKEVMPRVFDRPTSMTMGAVLYRKATKADPTAEIWIRDEAAKGVPPARYLAAQVDGGDRRRKGIELQLDAAGRMPSNMFVVPGKGAILDAHGNLPLSQLNKLKAQLGAHRDSLSNESDKSRARRLRRAERQGQRGGNYFALTKAHGKLKPGVYERLTTGFGSAVRSVLHYVSRVQYRKRYDISGIARKIFDRRFPDVLASKLSEAIASSWGKR